MWTAEVISKTKDTGNGNIVATVRFSDGKGTQDARLSATDLADEYIKDFCAKRIALLDARDTAFEALSTGAVTPQAKVDDAKAVFLVAYQKALTAVEAARAGVLTAAQAQVYVDAAKMLYRAEYLGL